MFPALCFTDISNGIIDNKAKKNLKDNLNEEEFKILTEASPTIQIKFKFI